MLKRWLSFGLSAAVVAILPTYAGGQIDPYDTKSLDADPTIHRPIPVYSQDNAPPTQWQQGQNTSESYRRCCTSVGWVAQALALRLMHAEKAWDHDAFFDYVDRWMYEDDSAFVKTIKDAAGRDHNRDYARQGQAWDAFVNEMWAKHRSTLPAPTDGWKQPHDDTYYRTALANTQK